jgi:hypothetical protein
VRKYIKVNYDEAKRELIEEIAGSSISITTDMWTSLAREGYITITSHYITNDWKLKCKVLATRPMSEWHTGMIIIDSEYFTKNIASI